MTYTNGMLAEISSDIESSKESLLKIIEIKFGNAEGNTKYILSPCTISNNTDLDLLPAPFALKVNFIQEINEGLKRKNTKSELDCQFNPIGIVIDSSEIQNIMSDLVSLYDTSDSKKTN